MATDATEVPLRARFSPPGHTVTEAFGQEILILDADSNRYYGLNHTGAELYRALAQGMTFGEALDRLAGRYRDAPDPEALRADAVPLIASLVERGLLLPADR